MKTLRFKLTPHPHAATSHLEVLFYSCPDIKGDPDKTLAHLQKVAKQRHVAFDYELTTDLEYFAVRGARTWLYTDPTDLTATEAFKAALMRAGAFAIGTEILGVMQSGGSGHGVQLSRQPAALRSIHVRARSSSSYTCRRAGIPSRQAPR